MPVISLLVLALVVAVGFTKKVNLGFLSLGAAFILGTAGGMTAKEITAGFNTSMFVTLTGVTFFFGIASQNGTLELFSKKLVAMAGTHTVLIPVLMFTLSAFLSAIGPGHIAAGILMTAFAMHLAFEMDLNPVAMALYAKLGANAGSASPLSPAGIQARILSEPLGYGGFELHIFLTTLLSGFVFAAMVYILYKGCRVKGNNPLKLSDLPGFNRSQLYTMAAAAVMIVFCIGFKFDTGLFAFAAAGVLILLDCADEKKAIQGVPWSTLILICGVGVLVSVIDKLGGISIVSDFLTALISPRTAAPVFAATSGVLSWVSSTTGVVMPTMFPIAAQVCGTFGTRVSYAELISAVTAASFAAAISPLSTGGAIIMSSYSAAKKTTTAEMNAMFRTLFLLSAANITVNVIMAALGVFRPGGWFV